MATTRASVLKAIQAAATAASTRKRSSKRTHSPPKITPKKNLSKYRASKTVKSKKKRDIGNKSSEDELSGDTSVATKLPTNTLLGCPDEIILKIYKYLRKLPDLRKTSTVCFGLTCKRFCEIRWEFSKTKNSRRRLWRGKADLEREDDDYSEPQLNYFLRSWMWHSAKLVWGGEYDVRSFITEERRDREEKKLLYRKERCKEIEKALDEHEKSKAQELEDLIVWQRDASSEGQVRSGMNWISRRSEALDKRTCQLQKDLRGLKSHLERYGERVGEERLAVATLQSLGQRDPGREEWIRKRHRN